jgi:hypothetical protein
VAEQDANTTVAAVYVVHLLGQQSVIGQVTRDGADQQFMEHPYEIMVLPSDSKQSAQVTLIKFGSMLGLMPELAVERIDLTGHRILGYRAASNRMVEEYLKALNRELNPVTKEEVAALLHPGKASSSGESA